MDYALTDARAVLERTPDVLGALLLGLPDAWTRATPAPGAWSPYDVVGHLIHGERTDWIPRVDHILQHGETVAFPPFDREAMFEGSAGRPLGDLLDEFAGLRRGSLARLDDLDLDEADLARRGLHPDLGVVTLGQHLATWVAHDLGHTAQVVRAMAAQYGDAVGPWRRYLSILSPR